MRSELRRTVDCATFDLWLAALQPHSLRDGVLVITAPDEIRTWIADRFGPVLEASAAAALGGTIAVSVVARSAPAQADGGGPTSARPAVPAPDDPGPLHPKLTFDQFVIGRSNRFAHAAALAVAELPSQAYNPLFLYGPPGVGKTHLLHSIGNYVRRYGAGLTVRLATAESFTNEFVAALQAGDIEGFKARFRGTDVLLIDDVQFLERKAKTEEEFFHTFNALYETGSQLVLTSDRLPADMAALEDRLRERFQAGLVVDVADPDFDTRMAILRKRVQHDGIELAGEGALEAIARRVSVDARTLEGALIRVVAYHSLTGRALDAALADEVLGSLYPGPRPGNATPTIERIQELTCAEFGVTHAELVSPSRAARLAWARQVAMFLAREHTGATLPAIGRSFGNRNHTTVMHACKRAGERIATDPDAQAVVHNLTQRLTEPGC